MLGFKIRHTGNTISVIAGKIPRSSKRRRRRNFCKRFYATRINILLGDLKKVRVLFGFCLSLVAVVRSFRLFFSSCKFMSFFVLSYLCVGVLMSVFSKGRVNVPQMLSIKFLISMDYDVQLKYETFDLFSFSFWEIVSF